MDRNRAITAEDLIRRYDLENLKTVKKTLKNVTNILENQYILIKQYIKNVTLYTNQVDSTTWFYNGTPTLLNEPFKTFTEEELPNRINNLYYDRDTGYVYRLEYANNTYSWNRIYDNSLEQSLAIANSDADSQDNRRNLFYNNPTPSYEVGDIWINDDVIMRCRCSRDGDNFKETEWVEQNNYSEAGVLLDVRAVLNSLITDVTDNYVTTTRLETTKNTIEAEVKSKLDGVDDANGNVTAASIVLSINGSDSSVLINGNKMNISANDILNILAGNTINITSKNINLDSTNFQVSSNGIMRCISAILNNAVINGGNIELVDTGDSSDPTIEIYDETEVGESTIKIGDDLSGKTLRFTWPTEGSTTQGIFGLEGNYVFIQSAGGYTISGGASYGSTPEEIYELKKNGNRVALLYDSADFEGFDEFTVDLSVQSYALPSDFGKVTTIKSGNNVYNAILAPNIRNKSTKFKSTGVSIYDRENNIDSLYGSHGMRISDDYGDKYFNENGISFSTNPALSRSNFIVDGSSFIFSKYINGILNRFMFDSVDSNNAYFKCDVNGNEQLRINKYGVFCSNLETGNIETGDCVLDSSNYTTVYFSKTFSANPRVILTPLTSTAGVIAPKVTEVTDTYFKATIGGSVSGQIACSYIAIC